MNAEVPHFMSITKQSKSSANFFDKIDDVIKEISLVVSVTSRREYNFWSAGTNYFVYPPIIWFMCFNWLYISSSPKKTLKPGMAYNLSSVPPVWPKPLPAIMGLIKPNSTSKGDKIMEDFSPIPPDACLSTTILPVAFKSFKFKLKPLFCMAYVKYALSLKLIPLKQMAINNTDV